MARSITVEHEHAKKIITGLEAACISYDISFDDGEVRYQKPSNRPGTYGQGVKTTILVDQEFEVEFDDICFEVFGVSKETCVGDYKMMSERWPFNLLRRLLKR